MRRRGVIATVLGLALSAAVMTPALAYFSATTQAVGGVQIRVRPDTTITEEEVVQGRKVVTITNLDSSGSPVMVRARFYAPSNATVNPDLAGTGWYDGGDGWYYFDQVLGVGEAAKQFVLNVVDVTVSEDIADPDDPTKIDMNRLGDNFNVIVVYEATNVIDRDGEAPVGRFGRSGA